MDLSRKLSITQKTVAALAGVFLALLAGAALILDWAVRPQFDQLEIEQHARNQARVSASLDALASNMRSRVTDYAYWDDTYLFLDGRDPGYTQDFTDDWFADYGVDVLVFADDAGGVVWTRGRDGRGAVAVNRGAAEALISQARRAPNASEPAVGAVWLDGLGFVIFAASPSLHSDGSGPPRGLVVIGQRLSETVLREQAQLQIELVPAASPSVDLATPMQALAGQGTQTWVTANALKSLIPLHDLEGRVIGAVLATEPREITSLGARSLGIALALFMGVSALAVIALWLLLRGAVIGRLERLERHFNAQSGEPEPLPASHDSDDEITRLTAAYNALVLRSREAALRAHDAQLQRDAEATANRMKSDFLANVSHELRTPLDAVIGYAELIAEDLAEGRSDSAGVDLERITDAARHLLTLINEVLDLSKIEAGKLEIRPHAFDVAEMLREAVDLVAPSVRDNECTLKLDVSTDLGIAYSDQTRLRQSLINVLSSACKFAEGGTVELIARRCPGPRADVLRFEVRDDGIGMSEAQLARIFEPFAHADPSAVRRNDGTGLGLAITRKVMELLNGAIEVRSVEGEGSTFVITASAVLDGLASPRVAA